MFVLLIHRIVSQVCLLCILFYSCEVQWHKYNDLCSLVSLQRLCLLIFICWFIAICSDIFSFSSSIASPCYRLSIHPVGVGGCFFMPLCTSGTLRTHVPTLMPTRSAIMEKCDDSIAVTTPTPIASASTTTTTTMTTATTTTINLGCS